MDKPKSKAALTRYLTANPYLKFFHPGGVTSIQAPTLKPRKFLHMKAGRFVFETEDGKETNLDMPGKEAHFFDDRFEVEFGKDWGDLAGQRMVYWYMSQPYLPGPDDLKPEPLGEKPTKPPTNFDELCQWLRHNPNMHFAGIEDSLPAEYPGDVSVTYVDKRGWFWLKQGGSTFCIKNKGVVFEFTDTGFNATPETWTRQTPKPTFRYTYKV